MDTTSLKEGSTVIYNKHAGSVREDGLVDGGKCKFIKSFNTDSNEQYALVERDGEKYSVREDELSPTLKTRLLPDWIPL